MGSETVDALFAYPPYGGRGRSMPEAEGPADGASVLASFRWMRFSLIHPTAGWIGRGTIDEGKVFFVGGISVKRIHHEVEQIR